MPADRHTASRAVLAVDTCGGMPGVALAVGGVVREAAPVATGARADAVARLASQLLSDAGVGVDELSGLGVTLGPGSYTGVRIGLALVRGLSIVDRLPVVGIGSLELLALAAGDGDARLCALLDAGAETLYAAVYERAGDGVVERCPPQLVANVDLPAFLDENANGAVVARSAGERALDIRDRDTREVPALRAAALAVMARSRLAVGAGESADSLLPLYVGPTNARPNRNKVVVARSRLE